MGVEILCSNIDQLGDFENSGFEHDLGENGNNLMLQQRNTEGTLTIVLKSNSNYYKINVNADTSASQKPLKSSWYGSKLS